MTSLMMKLAKTLASCALALLLATNRADELYAQAPGPSETPDRAALEGDALADWLEQSFEGSEVPEAVRMLAAISRGSQLGPGEGWFGPGQTRYTWEWLAASQGDAAAQAIGKDQFSGSSDWFDRLDRNKDGRIAASDLDWSDRNPYVQAFYNVNRLLRNIDSKGDGRLTREDYMELFDRAAQGRDHITTSDLAEVLLAGFSSSAGSPSGGGPAPDVLVRGLFRGEIGSLYPGPSVNDPAPDFSLKSHDGRATVRLSELRGSKPVVLVFGNFTCGPFRSMYPLVDDLCQRYQSEATFLSVYVREAHPADGWRMDSNARVGIDLAQPKSYDERVSVAGQCHALLKYSMPLLVDEINDPVGLTYSGMPARLYVIDPEGRVAYKSGRGPFGFKAGEMEQALVMTLLDWRSRATAAEQVPESSGESTAPGE